MVDKDKATKALVGAAAGVGVVALAPVFWCNQNCFFTWWSYR